jgi:hypothetical protein
MKPINRRQVIEHALQIAELVNRYIPRAIEKGDVGAEGLIASMADVLDQIRSYLASPDSMSQEQMRRIAASADSLFQEYTRRRRSWQPSKKDADQMPPEEIGEGDDQEGSDDEAAEEDESPATMSLKKAIRRRLRGTDSARAFWDALGYR